MTGSAVETLDLNGRGLTEEKLPSINGAILEIGIWKGGIERAVLKGRNGVYAAGIESCDRRMREERKKARGKQEIDNDWSAFSMKSPYQTIGGD